MWKWNCNVDRDFFFCNFLVLCRDRWNFIGKWKQFTTPSISSTTTYYAEANNGCPSATRTAVQAIISPLPAAPSASNNSRCGTGTVTLTASSPEQVYLQCIQRRYIFATNSSYTTPSISVTTTYYAEAGNTCRSATRTAVQAIIAIPNPPSASDVSRCGSGTVTLTATSNETIYWYSAASGGTLATSPSYTTPSLSVSTTYYVETGNTWE